MRYVGFVVAAALGIAGPLTAQQHQHTEGMRHSNTDSAFAAVQSRGKDVMGVDQYTSRHVFESRPDGGRIELQRQEDDSADVAQIRRHLGEIVEQFRRGDFSAPFAVHAQQVPGTRVMAASSDRIRYTVRPLPRGGEIVISSRDAGAIAAVHEFLAFQRSDHRVERER
jgi:hypothetical protein